MAVFEAGHGAENGDPSTTALHDVSLIEYLLRDKRPVFVLDIQKQSPETDQPLSAAFINPALRGNGPLFRLIAGHNSVDPAAEESEHRTFFNWTKGSGTESDSSEIYFAGFNWSYMTLAKRWKVIVADTARDRCEGARPGPSSTSSVETSSRSAVDADLSAASSKTNPADHDSRSNGQATSMDSKSSSSPARPRYFYAEEPRKSNVDQHPRNIDDKHGLEIYVDAIQSVASEASLSGAWSEILTARRNADLITKISAFDAMGISITSLSGEVVFANDAWYRICQLPHGPTDAVAWMSIFDEAEVLKVADIWKDIVVKQEVAQFEIPLKRRWKPPVPSGIDLDSEDIPAWISVWAYPDVSPAGETLALCCLLTDISQQKWSDRMVEKQLAEAVERAEAIERASKDLIASETRFRRIADSIPHGIFMCDLEGKMIYANRAYLEIFSDAGDPTIAEPWWDNVPEDEIARATDYWRRLREKHITASFEISLLKFSSPTDGTPPISERRHMAVSIFPELNPDGQIRYVAGSLTDISHLKMAEEAQVARAVNAEESKRQLEQFIDMTSHEIRNPLSAIVHSAEEVLTFLRNYAEPPSAAAIKSTMDTVETILDCTNHSTRIVDDILVVSKLDSGLLNIAPAPVQFIPAVKRALNMFDGEIRAANISSTLTIHESWATLGLDWVCVDISRVLQIFVNLLTNAIKFTRPESIRKINTHIHASTDKSKNEDADDTPRYLAAQTEPSSTYLDPKMNPGESVFITISVTDSGCGLSEDEQKNLFRRFSQAGTRTHVKYGGTGLGLFISRQLSEMQGGQIGLRSSPGKGSTFAFYVKALKSSPPRPEGPRSPAGFHVGNRQPRSSQPKASTITSVENSTAKSLLLGQTILLVEDNLVNQKVVAKMLRGQGFIVLLANNGQEALNRIRESALFAGAPTTAPPISFILLDVEMPVMDGLTCIRHIRKMEDTGELRGHVPVIATTANARQEQIEQAKKAGMDDVVTKPFRMEQLLSVMTQLWEQYLV